MDRPTLSNPAISVAWLFEKSCKAACPRCSEAQSVCDQECWQQLQATLSVVENARSWLGTLSAPGRCCTLLGMSVRHNQIHLAQAKHQPHGGHWKAARTPSEKLHQRAPCQPLCVGHMKSATADVGSCMHALHRCMSVIVQAMTVTVCCRHAPSLMPIPAMVVCVMLRTCKEKHEEEKHCRHADQQWHSFQKAHDN